MTYLVTCEHGGNRIPDPYRALFAGQRRLLDSHRGFDPGAPKMAQALADALAAPLVIATVSRLLVDLNRSVGHPHLFSAPIRSGSPALRAAILERHYFPHRRRIESLVRESVGRGDRVVHIGSHSFTPELDGVVRNADVGLLYDPARGGEAQLCADWQKALAVLAPRLRVRRNYPYAGKGDGLTAYLRRQFDARQYVGIELEVNQRIVFAAGPAWRALRAALVDGLLIATAGP